MKTSVTCEKQCRLWAKWAMMGANIVKQSHSRFKAIASSAAEPHLHRYLGRKGWSDAACREKARIRGMKQEREGTTFAPTCLAGFDVVADPMPGL